MGKILCHEVSVFSIAIVNYKTMELTRACLDFLKKHLDAGLNAVVWVVDNNSQDESTTYLRSLEWINLIERAAPSSVEKGFIAHGNGLDAILEKINTDYLFLMHTDTFVHDPSVFDHMLRIMHSKQNVAAIGCLEQQHRGFVRSTWRLVSRFLKMNSRKIGLRLGINSRQPKSLSEQHIKSFFACWDVRILRQFGYTFLMDDRNPGYELQDRLKEKGYSIETIGSGELFQYLDHIKAGTKSSKPRPQPSMRKRIEAGGLHRSPLSRLQSGSR